LINGVEGGSLTKGGLVMVTALVKNEGGADAYGVLGELEIASQYVTVACDDAKRDIQNLPAGGELELSFTVITNPDMPYGHQANMELNLTAQYGRAETFGFSVTNSISNNYCPPGSTSCASFDKFTLVQLAKTSAPTDYLINNSFSGCTSGGYENFTSTVVNLEPGQQYTIKIGVSSGGQQTVRGWFDLNGNDVFDSNEELIAMLVPSNSTNTQTFTIPEDFAPGSHRFRLRCQYNTTIPQPCNTYTYGQTHDYTIVLPEIYSRVQNVEAVLDEPAAKITVTWNAPAEGTPEGYNIYRNGNKLNTALLTTKTFIEENVINGVYAYGVTAVYAGNKESYAEMSNVICYFTPPVLCETPVNPNGVAELNTAIITWEEPDMDGTLINYNIYRDGEKIGETLPNIRTYSDKDLAYGTYIYQVSASYGHCEESDKTESVSVKITACEPPANLHAAIEDLCRVALTWEAPETNEDLLGYIIYRNEDKINVEPVIETEYFDQAPNNGTYSYQVSAVYGYCEESELTEAVTVEITCVGISDNFATSFNLYPNPTTGKLTIETSDIRYPILDIEIYDVYGRKCHVINSDPLMEGWQLKADGVVFDITHLQSGIYFVKILTDNEVVTMKFVKL
jgi:hypothetical protein